MNQNRSGNFTAKHSKLDFSTSAILGWINFYEFLRDPLFESPRNLTTQKVDLQSSKENFSKDPQPDCGYVSVSGKKKGEMLSIILPKTNMSPQKKRAIPKGKDRIPTSH